ncbi:Mpo1-like protein [Roseococcus sp. YIM B11640]|uniref:Mpo1-like protein n=1 Tax=Roseococcus sp. YIM B11640 TaxID=3133973 RepID=UPI003C7DE7AB
MTPSKPRSFREFWPFYVGEHLDARNRLLHFIGSSAAIACLLVAAVTGQPWWLLAAVVAGYALAWIGHFTIERNRPATFRHPFYSLLGDWKMFALMLTGRMEREVARIRAGRP